MAIGLSVSATGLWSDRIRSTAVLWDKMPKVSSRCDEDSAEAAHSLWSEVCVWLS